MRGNWGAGLWGAGVGAFVMMGCSGGSATSDAPGASSGTSGGASSSSGGQPGTSNSPLIGTWDVVSMLGKRQHTAVLTIAPTKLELTWKKFRVTSDLSANVPDISFEDRELDGSITATHVLDPLDVGQIPYAIGGLWTFQGKRTDRCTAKVSADSTIIECLNLGDPMRRVFGEYDYDERKYLGKGTTTVQRKGKLASDFGELGGEWIVNLPRAQCSVAIEGKTFKAKCFAGYSGETERSDLTLTFADGVASGVMNAGELSARRR